MAICSWFTHSKWRCSIVMWLRSPEAPGQSAPPGWHAAGGHRWCEWPGHLVETRLRTNGNHQPIQLIPSPVHIKQFQLCVLIPIMCTKPINPTNGISGTKKPSPVHIQLLNTIISWSQYIMRDIPYIHHGFVERGCLVWPGDGINTNDIGTYHLSNIVNKHSNIGIYHLSNYDWYN